MRPAYTLRLYRAHQGTGHVTLLYAEDGPLQRLGRITFGPDQWTHRLTNKQLRQLEDFAAHLPLWDDGERPATASDLITDALERIRMNRASRRKAYARKSSDPHTIYSWDLRTVKASLRSGAATAYDMVADTFPLTQDPRWRALLRGEGYTELFVHGHGWWPLELAVPTPLDTLSRWITWAESLDPAHPQTRERLITTQPWGSGDDYAHLYPYSPPRLGLRL